MKLSKDCPPNVRRGLKGGDLLLIANAEPKDAEAWFGYGVGWTCRIRLNRVEIGAAHGMFTMRGALAEALKDYHAREKAA